MERSLRSLPWIQHNRPAHPPDTVGAIARKVIESQCLTGPAWRRSVFTMLEEHAGPELLEHVAGINLSDGVLRLEVAEPAVAYHLGMRWEQQLLEACQASLPAAGVHTVRFTARART